MAGTIRAAKSMVNAPPIGSTAPDKTPRANRHGDDGSLREVLDGDAQGQGQRAACGDHLVSRQEAGIDHAHGHSLRDVVQGDRQHQHGRPLQGAYRALRLIRMQMQVRDQVIKQKQKYYACPEAAHSRQK